MSEPTVVLCAEPGPAVNDAPCCREQGHDGDHYTWKQMSNGHVWVITFDGERIMHLNMKGEVDAMEICALLAAFELMAARADGSVSGGEPDK